METISIVILAHSLSWCALALEWGFLGRGDLARVALIAPDVGAGSLVNILFLVALGLLVVVSGGILYLSSVKWRDRRLQKRDNKSG